MTIDTAPARPLPEPIRSADLLTAVHDGVAPTSARSTVFATGMRPLDDVFGGGFRSQDLVLVGGRPGIGKTIAALQWARHLAVQEHDVWYVCYEHSPQTLLGRLLALELGSLARADEIGVLARLHDVAPAAALDTSALHALLAHPLGEEVYGRIRSYGRHLHLVQASGRDTDIGAIERLLRSGRARPAAVFVDYLQKVPVPAASDEHARTTFVAESLKELAMGSDVLVVAIAAADRDALGARRLRLRHLRGSSALGHECDAAILLNAKAVAVSKSHLAYDPVRAESFRRQVVFSVEKNRNGPAEMDLEFTKDFASYRFDPDGSFVTEKLVDEILYEE